MEIGVQQPDRLTLRLSRGELRQWNNALNEVCNGFSVANFQAAIGISQEMAIGLLDRVHSLPPDQPAVFLLEEVLAVRNALTAILAELDPERKVIFGSSSRAGFLALMTVTWARPVANKSACPDATASASVASSSY